MRHIHYFDGLRPESINVPYEDIFALYSTKTYIPFIDFPTSHEAASERARHSFLQSLHTLITLQMNLKGKLLMTVLYLLNEAINNIVDHCQSERGYIMAQYFAQKGHIDISIGDNGKTVRRSFNDSGKYEIITSDNDALNMAINGYSTKNRPSAEDRGYGISSSLKMLADGVGGTYMLMSGDAIFYKNNVKENIINIHRSARFEGTIVGLRIPLTLPETYDPYAYLS